MLPSARGTIVSIVYYRCTCCCLETSHGKITRHCSRYCTVAFCYMHKCELSYMCPAWHKTASTLSEIILNRVCGIWLGISKGANAIISKKDIRLDSQLLRLCNWSVLLLTVLHFCRVTQGNMHCISLAILSRLSRFPSPTVGTNWPFCVDVPLNNQPTKSWVCFLPWAARRNLTK